MIEQSMRRDTLHEQVRIQVNARCDKGIAPLVIALNEIPGVETFESCQDMGKGYGACVFFTYGEETEQELARLLQEISERLYTLGVPSDYVIRAEWWGSNTNPRGVICLPPENIGAVANGIKSIAAILKARHSETVGELHD